MLLCGAALYAKTEPFDSHFVFLFADQFSFNLGFKNSICNQCMSLIEHFFPGCVETTIWSKTSVANVEGDKKSEIFQCVLPRYKEKKVLNNYILGHRRMPNAPQTSEVILSKVCLFTLFPVVPLHFLIELFQSKMGAGWIISNMYTKVPH